MKEFDDIMKSIADTPETKAVELPKDTEKDSAQDLLDVNKMLLQDDGLKKLFSHDDGHIDISTSCGCNNACFNQCLNVAY